MEINRDCNTSLHDIIAIKSKGKIEKFYESNPEVASLPLEEQLERFSDELKHTTDFFRDYWVLNIFQKIVSDYSSSHIVKIASVGCSDGKEPYSLLLENWDQKERLQIDAFDIDPKMIKIANRGEYDLVLSRDIVDLICLEHLNLTGEAYELFDLEFGCDLIDLPKKGLKKRVKLTDETRKRVNFQFHNTFKEPLPQEYDIVLLSNVLPHYNSNGRERILSNLYGSLKGGGWLLCESTCSNDYNPTKVEYSKWMEDIQRLGFERDITPIPLMFQDWASKTYRKRESLMVQSGLIKQTS